MIEWPAMEPTMFYDRERLVRDGLLEKVESGYRLSNKGFETLSVWRKVPFDASRFWYAPVEVRELMAIELESLRLKSEEIMSYLARFREQSTGG
jgi:hypothetical protein